VAYDVQIRVVGLKDFTRDLKAMGNDLKDLKDIYRDVAETVRVAARKAAPKQQSPSIRKRVNQQGAFLDVVPMDSKGRERSLGVIMGAEGRFGWYAAPWFSANTARQFKPWVGNQWVPGEQGGKPYYIGDAINESLDQVDDDFWNGIERLARKAFPDGGINIPTAF
jgi:hypothetical protein